MQGLITNSVDKPSPLLVRLLRRRIAEHCLLVAQHACQKLPCRASVSRHGALTVSRQ